MNQIVKNALIKVNQIRNILGYKELNDLPKGERMDCKTCPIAQALNRDISTETIFFESTDNFVKLEKIGLERRGSSYNFVVPKELKLFIKEFDSGNLEEYELEETKEFREIIVSNYDQKVNKLEEDKPFNFT